MTPVGTLRSSWWLPLAVTLEANSIWLLSNDALCVYERGPFTLISQSRGILPLDKSLSMPSMASQPHFTLTLHTPSISYLRHREKKERKKLLNVLTRKKYVMWEAFNAPIELGDITQTDAKRHGHHNKGSHNWFLKNASLTRATKTRAYGIS